MSRWFEDPDLGADYGSNIDEEELERNPSPEFAGRTLCELLIYLRFAGRLSARMVCIIAYWAAHSKGEGGLAEMGRPPSWGPHRSGHFQRHLDDLLGFTTDWKHHKNLAELSLPGYSVHSAERTSINVLVGCPSEVISDEVMNDVGAYPALRENA